MPFETDKESSTMRSSLAEDGSKPETKLATFSDPPKQEALVAAAKSGEELAFEALVKRQQPRIFAVARCARYTSTIRAAKEQPLAWRCPTQIQTPKPDTYSGKGRKFWRPR